MNNAGGDEGDEDHWQTIAYDDDTDDALLLLELKEDNLEKETPSEEECLEVRMPTCFAYRDLNVDLIMETIPYALYIYFPKHSCS